MRSAPEHHRAPVFAGYWIGFAALFVALQVVVDEAPDAFGVVVLVVCAAPVAWLLTWLHERRGLTG